MTNELLDYLKSDIELIKRDNFHPKHLDLLRVVFESLEDLIKFNEKVNKVLDIKATKEDFTGNYSLGYLDGILQVKKEIYE